MSKPRFLTKSRFKIGCECPTKLYFTGKPEFGNNHVDNAFLAALAEGGFQVGELAKLYHPGGQEISTKESEKAIEETEALLKQNEAILYEPAIHTADLLVRVDVLVKKGNKVDLIEVKAKSFDPREVNPFYNKASLKKGTKKLSSSWEPYLLDIAFQSYVTKKAHPEWKVSSYLMLADKSATATVDGINQHFFLQKDHGGRASVVVTPGLKASALGQPLLVKVNVDEQVKLLHENGIEGVPFEDLVRNMAHAYVRDQRASPALGSHCKSCEFRIDEAKKATGLKSGFEECWSQIAHLKPADFQRPMIFEIWNYRNTQKLIDEGRYFIADMKEDDINPKPKVDEPGLSASERQWIQVERTKEASPEPFFDHQGMAQEMAKWQFPLHFIDFETTMVAIPFNKGRRPYEQIAFQFSHHVVDANGRIEHRTEYINTAPGVFPNFDFVRALKTALSNDNGTIFRFATHENTVLCQILEQLKDSRESDQVDLTKWIQSITSSPGSSEDEWLGPRSMVDICDLVKKYYYHPLTHGSNSIKKVLPAILATSDFLKAKYSKPVYGTKDGITSKNYSDWRWLEVDASSGEVKDPYKLLPPVFDDLDLETMDSLITEGSIADGGAAMTAYARMQFTQMSQQERDRVSKALLRYCELDTFAMVMIYEYWKDEILRANQGARAA